MNKKLQNIFDLIQQSEKLNAEQKENLLKAIKDADKELEITAFKLERTEKVKKTTAILLEETIEELEQKRKAVEDQNRKLEIETTLEKVRTIAMAMRQPDDMLDVCKTISQQLESLGVKEIRNVQTAIFYEQRGTYMNYEYYAKHDKTLITETTFTNNKLHAEFAFKMLKGKDEYFITHIRGDEVKDWIAYQRTTNVFIDKYLETASSLNYYWFSLGPVALGISTYHPLTDEEINLFQRFLKVFELAYQRYLDIENAIAQAREAQIQLALERVRARTMAMQKSDELADTAAVVFQQLINLGIEPNRIYIAIIKDEKGKVVFWITNEDGSKVSSGFEANLNDNGSFQKMLGGWNGEKKSIKIDMQGKELQEYFNHLTKLGVPFKGGLSQKRRLQYIAYFSKGFIGVASPDETKPETLQLLERFAAVFDGTYRRFLDLQKAEEQAREAQIQLALERVRARTMAMHKSDELPETSHILFEQMKELGEPVEQLTIGIIDEENNVVEISATLLGDTLKKIYRHSIDEPYMMNKVYKAWKKQQKTLVVELRGNELNAYNKYRNELTNSEMFPTNFGEEHRRIVYAAFFSKGMLALGANEPRPSESIQLLERFASVFDLTYTRFLDLQKAEAQTREAQIEAALERVRSRSMGMQKSEELKEVIRLVYEQFVQLKMNVDHAGFVVDYSPKGDWHFWIADKQEIPSKITHPYFHSVWADQFDEAKNKGIDFFATNLNFEEKNKFYRDMFKHIPGLSEASKEFYFNCPGLAASTVLLDNIGLYIENFSGTSYSNEENKILLRFGKVFQQTYTRFLDLQKVEAQAREAIKQASLDRIRGEIASMRTSEDLNRITPIIWRELKTLEVPFIRCGVFIVDEEKENVQVYLTTPDGKSLGVLNLSFTANELTSNTVDFWKKKQVYKQHWTKEEFINWTKSMIESGQVQNAVAYQGSASPPESLDLHFVPFAQGMLYVGDINPLTNEKLDLVKSLAESFSIAYARYEDFKHLEDAKNKIELTLLELKEAQAQLIHSEKMASLGELTAGIAHEIKNPLNFVNNFSEISGELIHEIKEELEQDDKEEALSIIEDLKQNLEKINQHGKRADSIVKGMLLHSRGSSGEKTLTDINDLLDQYVNLAYHGMRAQNKEFNITIEKDYDKTLGKINIVPQDISRVFLNIINNACYAAYDKKKKGEEEGFSPTLKVSTQNLNGKIVIKIGDNGNGIPKDIIDKIFQPFFTTKPTGEGTGLGLSLSYDIVTKQHSGELWVETKDGRGSEFIITLPQI